MMPCVGDTALSDVGAAMSGGWSEGVVGGWIWKVREDKRTRWMRGSASH